MPDLVPTLATALLGADGELLHVFAALKYKPGKEAEGYVPCLILPAWRPIAEAPKNRTLIMAYDEDQLIWREVYWEEDGRKLEGGCMTGGWTDGRNDERFMQTRVYAKWWLPTLPSPEEAPR